MTNQILDNYYNEENGLQIDEVKDFKGIYFKQAPQQEFFLGGAHFDHFKLVKRLSSLAKERKIQEEEEAKSGRTCQEIDSDNKNLAASTIFIKEDNQVDLENKLIHDFALNKEQMIKLPENQIVVNQEIKIIDDRDKWKLANKEDSSNSLWNKPAISNVREKDLMTIEGSHDFQCSKSLSDSIKKVTRKKDSIDSMNLLSGSNNSDCIISKEANNKTAEANSISKFYSQNNKENISSVKNIEKSSCKEEHTNIKKDSNTVNNVNTNMGHSFTNIQEISKEKKNEIKNKIPKYYSNKKIVKGCLGIDTSKLPKPRTENKPFSNLSQFTSSSTKITNSSGNGNNIQGNKNSSKMSTCKNSNRSYNQSVKNKNEHKLNQIFGNNQNFKAKATLGTELSHRNQSLKLSNSKSMKSHNSLKNNKGQISVEMKEAVLDIMKPKTSKREEKGDSGVLRKKKKQKGI
eukprot:CAMPEP_0170536954 /NCGR_PEP_ID=MMETSP0209-20121228/102434_1 /TAXON_ID=665100 ORGANISM="Litonotus pictus, Strain P1" /NCGR_SAMPLE_ID=MMETSP0209 /ASSEMBLY_ACC=CAM_ASM_000301 /LENGTH=458 /DNA_ID=CAMNT_0010838381 /DNA_START=14 /DNA_END=1391 /DNA_ORIENTATION=+